MQLPCESLLDIMQFLPCLEVVRSREVCHKFLRAISGCPQLWILQSVTVELLRTLRKPVQHEQLKVFHRLCPHEDEVEHNLHPMAIIDHLKHDHARMRADERASPKVVRIDLRKGYNWPTCTAYCYENCRKPFGQRFWHTACLAKHVPVAQLLAFMFSLQAQSYFLDGVNSGYFRELLDRMISEKAALSSKLIVVSDSDLTADSW
ncbi:hypothetical protein AAVH_35025, partial [Aphelenchoides avenae]